MKLRKKRIEKESYIRAHMNDFENYVNEEFNYVKQLSQKFLPPKKISPEKIEFVVYYLIEYNFKRFS